MPTAKQIAARRANGQKSRGAVTTQGKAKSRFNALKHGIHAQTQIMFDETAEDQTGVDTYLDKHAEMEKATSGEAFSTIAPAFERLQRIVNCCERNYHRALNQLVALQVARDYAQPTPQPEDSITTTETPGSFRANPQAAASPVNPHHEPLEAPDTPSTPLSNAA